MNKVTHHTQPIPVVRPATDTAIIAPDKPTIPNAGTAPYLRRVVCAANRTRSGDILLGARHCDVMMDLNRIRWTIYQRSAHPEKLSTPSRVYEEEQGFIDQHGVFMTRQEALTVARAAGQIRYRCGGDEHALYSENLY